MGAIAGIVNYKEELSEVNLTGLAKKLLHRGSRTTYVDRSPNCAIHLFEPRHSWHWESEQWKVFLSSPKQPYSGFFTTWKKDPIASLHKLPNAFSIIAWEKKRQRHWLIRDSVGIQSLYWSNIAGQLSFSSEIQALHALPSVSKDLAIEHLAEYLSFRYVHAPRTLFKDINSVPVGHFVIVDKERSQEKRWHSNSWRAIDDPSPNLTQACSEIDLILRRTVEETVLTKPNEIGILLSGGLDSSAILHHASQLGRTPPSFTVMLENAQADESPFAARVARLKGSHNHILRVESKDFIEHLHRATEFLGQPLPTAAAAIQLQLFDFAKEHVDSLLTGDGGDEILGGRSMPQLARRIQQSRAVERLPYLPKRAFRHLAKKAGKRDLAAEYTQWGQERFIGGSSVFLAPNRVSLLTDPGFVRPNIRQTVLTPYYQEVDSDPINDILHVWQRGGLVEDALVRSDRLSAHSQIQLHFPMLNRRLIEYCEQLPGDYKVRKQRLEYISKYPLRMSMKNRLPKRLLRRPKRTWLNPLDHWLRHDGRPFLHAQITEICQEDSYLFVPEHLQKLYREHVNKVANHGLKLWTLILFHLWWKTI